MARAETNRQAVQGATLPLFPFAAGELASVTHGKGKGMASGHRAVVEARVEAGGPGREAVRTGSGVAGAGSGKTKGMAAGHRVEEHRVAEVAAVVDVERASVADGAHGAAHAAVGASNVELNALCFRYGARIFELRRRGYQIKTRSEGHGVFRFVLNSEYRTQDAAKLKGATAGRQVVSGGGASAGCAVVSASAIAGAELGAGWWPGAVLECPSSCRCICHTFAGANRRPCISCPA